jgi:hypothetical protein
MIFKTYPSESVARVIFNGFFIGNIFLSIIALFGFASGAGLLSTLSGFMHIVIVSVLSLNEKFRKNNFSVWFCFFTFLFLNIPAAFILFEGVNYTYGDGLASIPYKQSDYQKTLPLGFSYLSILWFSIWLGVITAGTKIRKINQMNFKFVNPIHILLLGFLVLIVTWLDNISIARAGLGTEKINSIMAFVFFDHAYLVMAGLLLFFKINEPGNIARQRKITSISFLIFIIFLCLFFQAGSKGAILAVFTLFLIMPFSVFREFPHARVIFPSIKFIILLVLCVMPLFYLALIQRISLGAGIFPDMGTLLEGLSAFEASVVYDMARQILYRLSWGGIDRFLLVFQSFTINSYDPDTALEFVAYLSKNTLNLVLPGTPFPESYAPSSQLFEQVIDKNLVGGEIDTETLIKSFNTQPYTIFSVFTIIFGLASPIFLCTFTFLYIFIYNKFGNVFVKISMIYFFWGALTSFGVEVALGNSIHLYLSILLMYLLIKSFSYFSFLMLSLKHSSYNKKINDDFLKMQACLLP